LAVSIVFSTIAIIEGVIISPIFYSMAGVILAMLGYLMLSNKLGQKKPEEPPQQKE
jgi:hypothetical protein